MACPGGVSTREELRLMFSRFPIVSGLAVKWDHRKPPGKRIESIHLTVPSRQHDEECELIHFVDNDDGTRIEIASPKLKLGAEVKNIEGGRKYYVVSCDKLSEADLRLLESTCLMALTASKPSRGGSSLSMTRTDRL